MSAKIRYALVGHCLTEEQNYRARVLPARTATIEDVADRIVKQGSTVTRSDILGVLEGFNQAIEDLVLDEGARVVTDLATFNVGIKGLFEEHDEAFDPERHRVMGKVSVGPRLQKSIDSRAQVARRPRSAPAPQPLKFYDVTSGERNGAVTPGGMCKVMGHYLKIDPTDEGQGIFFVDVNGDMTRVTLLGQNLPTLLLFQAPADLAPGSCRLVVQTAHGVKTLHWEKTEIVLTV